MDFDWRELREWLAFAFGCVGATHAAICTWEKRRVHMELHYAWTDPAGRITARLIVENRSSKRILIDRFWPIHPVSPLRVKSGTRGGDLAANQIHAPSGTSMWAVDPGTSTVLELKFDSPAGPAAKFLSIKVRISKIAWFKRHSRRTVRSNAMD